MSDPIRFEVRQGETRTVNIPCVNCGKINFEIVITKDSMQKRVCPECKTSTYVYITPNLDIVVYREDELCPECKGTGKCSTCNGTGKMLCPTCKGKGYVESWGFYHGCPVCGGKGESLSPSEVTKGTGFVTCRQCLGSGVCPTCKGFRGLLRFRG